MIGLDLLNLFNDNNADIALAFREFVSDQAFPCVGAKAALAHRQIEFHLAGSITSPEQNRQITRHLQDFASQCSDDSLFVSFVVIFEHSPLLNEKEFERYLWLRLQAFHDLDVGDYAWDNRVSSDPDSPHFSMSIGGKAFYVVGLHPGASRAARRFKSAALVFNLHSQFELLREEGKYSSIRETILMRDVKVNGSYNPMLAEHGEISEASQYSGRQTSGEWKCPFHAHGKADGHGK